MRPRQLRRKPRIEVVDLVWKGLRHVRESARGFPYPGLKSLTWFGRDCDTLSSMICFIFLLIEVVDLVWKGLRPLYVYPRRITHHELKSLTWFGRDCDPVYIWKHCSLQFLLKSLTWFGRDYNKGLG